MQGNKITLVQIKEVRKQWGKGDSVKTIANSINICEATVRKIINREGPYRITKKNKEWDHAEIYGDE